MGGMHASAIQECQGWLASPETKRKAQDRSFPAAFSWFCPHLDLGLLKPPKLSETHFCCFKPPPGLWCFVTAAPWEADMPSRNLLSGSACPEQNREAQACASLLTALLQKPTSSGEPSPRPPALF